MNRRHTLAPALLLAAGLALTACGTSGDDPKKPQAQDPAAVSVAVAVKYETAVNARDWRRVCELSTQQLRDGTVEQCMADSAPTTPTAAPSTTASATATFDPPRYADGSTMPPPKPKPTSSGPDRAKTGPVTVERGPVQVSAIGDYAAGYGVMVSFSVTWPNETSTVRTALRVVKEGGVWRVDQSEDVHDGDMVQGDPIVNALMW
ncbi:hypothetical protein [Streptomyces sp. NPDC051079]|uniref:hypothetical protein n=1 Tax=Streptomyces sp. NPDC051079 TaxID=3155043 RepID=UPI00344B12D5